MSTKFCVAQTRGLHFNLKHWSRRQRHTFWRNVKDKDHPYVEKPIYSFAVYDRAGIKDFVNLSEIDYLRLDKIAQYLRVRLMHMPAETFEKEDNIVLPESCYKYKFENRRMQIQQLYSSNYERFHDFLESEKIKEPHTFVSDRNPYVSTADIQSFHGHRYAYGNKYYEGHEHERLRPKYNAIGKALRPHSGVVYLTLHPIEDYAKEDHNHIVSLAMQSRLVIEQQIIHERECTFFSFIEKGRVVFIHRAKFPSFDHEKYPKTFLHLYGLNEKLYFLFKQLITTTAPHDNKQRLAILLLGEYLAAYQTLYLMRYAHDKAKRLGYVILYRDKYGNFSLKPTYEISPVPVGQEDYHYLRRYRTHLNRLNFLNSSSDVSLNESIQQDTVDENNSVSELEGDDDSQTQAQREKRKADSSFSSSSPSPKLPRRSSVE